MTGYINKFDENKNKNKSKNAITMYLNVKDKQLKNYKKIWKQIEKLRNIDFNTKPTYVNDDKYIKAKIKTYADSITTHFYDKKGSKKIPEEKTPHTRFSIIILVSVIYAYKKYHPQSILPIFSLFVFSSSNKLLYLSLARLFYLSLSFP